MQDFFVLSQGFGSFPSVFLRAGLLNLVRVKCLHMIKPIEVGFCSIGVDATLGDECGI